MSKFSVLVRDEITFALLGQRICWGGARGIPCSKARFHIFTRTPKMLLLRFTKTIEGPWSGGLDHTASLFPDLSWSAVPTEKTITAWHLDDSRFRPVVFSDVSVGVRPGVRTGRAHHVCCTAP